MVITSERCSLNLISDQYVIWGFLKRQHLLTCSSEIIGCAEETRKEEKYKDVVDNVIVFFFFCCFVVTLHSLHTTSSAVAHFPSHQVILFFFFWKSRQMKIVSKWNINLSDFMQMKLKVFSSHTVMTDSQQVPQPGCEKKNCFHFTFVKYCFVDSSAKKTPHYQESPSDRW